MDDLLSRHLVKQLFIYIYALYNPDLIAAGAVNATATAFNLL